MSSLYKLSISGIRSFSPKDHETIQFGSPLTLICGQNGCGKTTIIESLKYVTTGDLPPNSKGGAFVNDPAIADRLLVNAEIKLGFISVDGKLMTVTRNMQLNRKRAVRGSTLTANTFKSLEGQLAVISNGNKTSYSSKNLELDTRVPLYLGASKAVLEYVIFCHQDDSLWPLSEASVLKKRFDEIFEALKFTKALDNLKLIRKEMATNIKFIEQSVQHSKIDQARAQKIRERLDESTEKAELYSTEIAALTVQIEELERQAENLFHSNQAFQKTLSEHERLRIMIELTSSSLKRLEGSIKILPETDDELSSMLSNFESVEIKKQEKITEVEEKLAVWDSQLKNLEAEHHKLVREEGSLIGRKKMYEKNRTQLAQLSLHLSEKYSIDDSFDSSSGIVDSLTMLKNDLIASDTLAINNAKRQAVDKKFQDIKEQIFKEAENSRRCESDLGAAKEEIRRLRASITELLSLEDKLDREKVQLANLESQYMESKASTDFNKMQLVIDEKKAEIASLEIESQDLLRKINNANLNREAYGKLKMLKDSLNLNQSTIDKVISTNHENFMKLTGIEMTPLTCESSLEKKIKDSENKLRELTNEVEKLKTTQQVKASSLENSQSQLKELEQKKSNHLEKIHKIIGADELLQYAELLQEAEEDFRAAQFNCNTFEVTKSFKSKAISIAQENGCCTLCNRGMSSAEKEVFITDIKLSILSATFEKLKEELSQILKELDDLKSIQYDVQEVQRVKNQISELEGVIVTTHGDLKSKDQEIGNALKNQKEVENELEELKALLKVVSKITSLYDELISLEKQTLNIELELSELGTDQQSIDTLQELQQLKAKDIKTLRELIERKSDEKSFEQHRLSKFENQVKDKQIEVSKLEIALNETKVTQGKIKDLQLQVQENELKNTSLLKTLEDLDSQKVVISEEAKKVKQECDNEDEKFKLKLSEIGKAIEKLEEVGGLVEHFEHVDQPLLEANTEQISKIKEEILGIEKKMCQEEFELKELQSEMNDSLSIKRNIRDNIEYRQTTQQLESLQSSFDSLDLENAELEQQRYQSKTLQLRERIAELNSQHYGKVGEVKQIKDQIVTMQKELQTDYKDVDEKHHKEWINLQTNMLVSTDLQTYSQALDSAIMKYHSMKMNEINRILRELWNQTYKGTDIDSIEIKCEVSTQNKARSYNYRVVMYKKSSELDMRGRCSAGQKVLTSILIRLALAECFGTNCGMIALDEPTTNLDVENAESLAHALNNIIAFRKNQKNFQLIVITHDEKFLSHIDGDRFTDNFYRIERDENQHSIIKSLPIHLMQTD